MSFPLFTLIVLAFWNLSVERTSEQDPPPFEHALYKTGVERFNVTAMLFEQQHGSEQAASLRALKQELIGLGHSEEVVAMVLSQARLNERVAELFSSNILRSADTGDISYEDFANRINLEELKQNSHGFAQEHMTELLQAEEQYGVDYRFIVAIKGIETRYGERGFTGNFNVLNSLVTQYVLTNRKRISVSQLDAILKLNEKFDAQVHTFNGSFAGAIGVAQWMPFSLLHYGKMERIEDITSTRKMIPSTANYLRENGWRPSLNGTPVEPGSRNWNAILRYNRSSTYARVVVEIAEQIQR